MKSSVSNLADEEIIGQNHLEDIRDSLLQQKYFTVRSQTPINEIFSKISNIESENELVNVLSSPALFYKENCRPEVINEALLDMFKENATEFRSEDPNNIVSDSQTDNGSNNEKWIACIKMNQTIPSVISDPGMIDLLKNVECSGQAIASQSQSE